MKPLQNIVIYQSPDGHVQVQAKIERETLWLKQDEIALLFGVQRPAITKHIRNIFSTKELDEKCTCSILEHMGNNGRVYKTIQYNLDMIIAVGYRVNSKRATQFRIWATDVLKQYLTQGYALNKHLLQTQQRKIAYLQQAIGLLSRATLANTADITAAIDVLKQFSGGLTLLDDYDNQQLDEEGRSTRKAVEISSGEFLELIRQMKPAFASDVFGNPKDSSFESSVNQIYQTFGKKELYPSIEQKAAILLYLIVKNHSFSDGNKRIAAACFLYFLEKNNLLFRSSGEPVIDNKALAALTLLIAVSTPSEKETLLRVILSILNR